MNALLRKIKNSRDVRDLSIVMAENLVTKVINFGLIILVARSLGPEQYGVYSMITVAILFLIPLIDFGMENTAIRFSGKYPDSGDAIFGLYTGLKFISIAVLCVVFFACPDFLAVLLHKPDVVTYLPVIFVGVCVEATLFVLTTYWQARERFYKRAVVQVGGYLIRFVWIFALLIKGGVTIMPLVWAFALAGVPIVLIYAKDWLALLRTLFAGKLHPNIVAEMIKYEKWMFIGSVSGNVMTRLDFFMVTYFLSFEQMGLYNAAFQLTAVLNVIPFVFGKVFLPKVSKLETREDVRAYLRKGAVFAGAIIFVGAIVLILSKFMVLGLYGESYKSAINVFRLLLLAFIFSAGIPILSMVFYTMEKPGILVLGTYLQLIVFVVCGAVMIPIYGVLGAAVSRVIANVVFLVALIFLHRHCLAQWKGLR